MDRSISKRSPTHAAIAFSDPSELTCIANDFGFSEVFARLVSAHAQDHDLLVVISTSGNSENLVRAAETARSMKLRSVGLLGKSGGRLVNLVDIPVVVPRANTSDRIQEIHIKVIHTVLEVAERRLFPENYGDF